MKLADDEYYPSLNTLKKTHIPELLTFFNKVIKENKVGGTDFWKLAAAYMYFLSDDVDHGKKYLMELEEDPSNPYVGKQKKLLGILFELQTGTLYDQSSFSKIYTDISSFKKMEKSRDMSAMKLISNNLTDYFLNRANAVSDNKPSSIFSG